MKSRSGKTFNAHIILNEKAESSFEFEQKDDKAAQYYRFSNLTTLYKSKLN